MPPEVWFYHLERSGLEAVLPSLLEKSLERGWRVVVRSPSKERVAALDDALWVYRDDSFLPHGKASNPHADEQPILLTDQTDMPNNPQLLILLDRAEPGEVEGLERLILLFDGQDEEAVAEARRRWKTFKDMGCSIAYWQQNERGGWEKKA